MPGSFRRAIVERYPFELDRFQVEALDAFDDGQHVIVAAPTGSGKTVVAEYGVETMLRSGRRAFYTAPIKALSNQKYRDLCALHGDQSVGLLTGDTVINGDAPIVVMTTEVLRNMIYAGRDLTTLGVVVLDEVHFLQDEYRGPVWEEVIIHLPAHVQLVCLSATVSNARDLGEWITTVRGPTHVVVEQRRPVELDQFYFVADRTNGRLRFMPTIVDGQPNRDAIRIDASGVRFGGRRRRDRTPRGSGERKLATPSREEVVATLADRNLLPAIYFIFSRAQCDAAAQNLVDSGMSFSEPQHQERIREIAADRLAGLHDDDLDVLGYEQFLRQLDAGVASHHAGLVPPFKEVVEQAFVEGLLQVVFATETLAVGVNMPARTVVIEKLTKYTGDRHETLSPGQFTQLTGRAGRRGIDDRGAAVVLWSPFVRFDDVAELALSRSFHLRSAFRPTFNMVANLVRTYDRDRARQLLTLSFAQHQADRDIVRIERRLQRQRERLTELREQAASPFGDIDEFRRTHTADGTVRGPIDESLAALRPGEVIHVDKGKHFGPAAVVATAHRSGGIKVTVITPSGHSIGLSADDFDAPVDPMGTIVLPGHYSPNRKDYRDEVGKRLKRAKLRGGRRRAGTTGPTRHPVEDDPELRQRLEAAQRADKTVVEIESLEQRVEQRNSSLGREFDAVLDILEQRGYVDAAAWHLTERGDALSNLFHESDLLVSEAMFSGVFDGLDDASLAGLVSCIVYEHRSPDDPPRPWFPNDEVRRRWEQLAEISDRLAADERRHGLSEHRAPDPGFLAIAYAWVGGEGFADIVAEEDLTGGDFVRTTKQLVDLLGQLGYVATDTGTRSAARRAVEAARRGVVADSSVVGP